MNGLIEYGEEHLPIHILKWSTREEICKSSSYSVTMVKVSDKELLAHAERVNGKVLLITGALSNLRIDGIRRRYDRFDTGGNSGIGKQTALLYAQYG
jgi:hypothetical protein